ncbi:hypothetical protein EAS62_36335 [Bradyrhizobium zhanjiangense]|uniref:Uncharacterized protein n=1 Tax=Bradyrhizobium zhanjiangense TaxID=1325107 RepID=A0ABY0DB98_9BRAD|nr:hypothetical protein EAS62_36335 [Bradyrhizobium zhanjiangense]
MSRRTGRCESSPLPACGERTDRIEDAIRVRGTLRESNCHRPCGDSPSPRPSPRKRGEGEGQASAIPAAHSANA